MNKLFALALLIAITAFANANAQTAYDAYKSGDFEKSISLYSDMISKNPTYAPGLYNRGLAYLNAGDKEKALNDFTSAIKLSPQNAEYYYARGLAFCHNAATLDLISTDTLESALKDFKKANEISPSAVYLYSMGISCISLEYFDLAVEYLTSAIQLSPSDPTLYYSRACAYFGLNEKKDCKSDLETFLQINKGKLNSEYVETANRLLEDWCNKSR